MNVKESDFFNSLVTNAMDFLDVAIGEIRERPKYSVIHFYSAVEIIFKSRLLLEHWALVWDEPSSANKTKFEKGNFRSVSLENSIQRLKAIGGVNIDNNSILSFQRLQDHRNQLIHFFHPEYGPNPSNEIIAAVVADLCVSWFYLHRILTKFWRSEYSSYDQPLDELNRRMMQLREYLTVRYESVKPDIAKGIERGVQFENCYSCGFHAAKITGNEDPLFHTTCFVCANDNTWLEVPCPKCSQPVRTYELGEGVCSNCETQINMGYLIDLLGTKQTPREALENPAHGYCTNCEWPSEPTVIPWADQYICLNCFSTYDYLAYCEWCNEKNAGDISDSYLYGCVLCEGRHGWGD